ncbi:MAG: hypothetical protein V3V13_09475 [Paracoccaceae bacterium]
MTDEIDDQIPDWFREIMPGGSHSGFLRKSEKHSLVFIKREKPVLMVSFDNLSNVSDRSTIREPWAYKFCKTHDISHLGVMANVANWFRDEWLIEQMESLAADGFFEGYERVVLSGTSMGAFAALTFAGLVPDSHVIALNPQTTLDTKIVPWEERFWRGRRQDWSLPYSDAAEGAKAAACVSLFYDPYFEPDVMQIARLDMANVTTFKCWYSSHKSAVFLKKIDALKPIMMAATFGELTQADFYSMYRKRKQLRWYVGALAGYFEESGRAQTAKRIWVFFREKIRGREPLSTEEDNGN